MRRGWAHRWLQLLSRRHGNLRPTAVPDLRGDPMTGADLQWWHFVAALATMLVFVAVFALQSAACQAERDRRIDGFIDAGLTEDEACALVDDLP